MSNPNASAMFLPRPYPDGLTPEWKKYIIQGATPNDTRLDFTMDQKSLIPRADVDTYKFTSYPRPNTGVFEYELDLEFMEIISPNFPIWVEKVKICLHQPSTYGCVKLNVWDYGDSLSNKPKNLIGVKDSEPYKQNIPLTILPNVKLVSNALANQDLYMIESEQETHVGPFTYTIEPNSILRYGIQYAEGNAYGVKIFIIGWLLECDTANSDSVSISESVSDGALPGGLGDFQMINTDITLTSSFDMQAYTIPSGLKGYTLVNSTSTRDEYEVTDIVGGKTYVLKLWVYKDGSENQYIGRLYINDSFFSEVWYTLTPAGQISGTHNQSQVINCTSSSSTVTLT